MGIFLLYLTASRNSAPAYYNLNILFVKFKSKSCWNILQKRAVTCTCQNKKPFRIIITKGCICKWITSWINHFGTRAENVRICLTEMIKNRKSSLNSHRVWRTCFSLSPYGRRVQDHPSNPSPLLYSPFPRHISPHDMHRNNFTTFSTEGFSIIGLLKYSVSTAGLI